MLTEGKHLTEGYGESAETHDEMFRGVYPERSRRAQHDNAGLSGTEAFAADRRVRFEVVTADTEAGLGFDPTAFSERGNALCPFCGSTVSNDYAKVEGKAGRIGTQPMAVVCTRYGKQGKVYLSADEIEPTLLPQDQAIRERIEKLCAETGLTAPEELTPH